MEVSALKTVGHLGLRGPTPLLRLQSDERLVALVRRGNNGAFEALVSRYQARLLSFCRHMLGSREDAEDVLQEVFAAAFNAMCADERPINVRPWLYRIARNRSLNHLRRAQPIGVDSMDVHFSEHGQTTADKVHRREDFRHLIEDVQGLPETQRTALLLREIDALSYEQIAEAMETTVPSVKSLLVRARVSLAEASEARTLTCDDVRQELGEVAEGLRRSTAPVRRHVRGCDRCATFRKQLRSTNKALAALLPVAPLLILKKGLLAHLGTTASAAGGSAAGSAAAAGAGAAAAGGASAMGAGISAVATKTAAGLAAAAIVTAGAVEVNQVQHDRAIVAKAPVVAQAAPAPAPAKPAEPVVVASRPQPVSAPVKAKAPAKAAAEVKPATVAKKTEPATPLPATPVPAPQPIPAVAPTQQGADSVTLPQAQPPTPATTGGTVAPEEGAIPPAVVAPAPPQPARQQPVAPPEPQPAPPPPPPPPEQPAAQQPPPAQDPVVEPAPPVVPDAPELPAPVQP